jgi:hypothetical protein
MQPKTTQAEFDARIAGVSEINWARLAAYIDSEGTIMIARTKANKGTKQPMYVLTLIVANTDLRLIRWLSETFTGQSYFSHSESQRRWSKKTCHSWRLFEKRAAVVLEKCLPYFIIKREQADVGLAYRALRDQGSKGRKLTPIDISEREEFRKQIRSLNGSKLEEGFAQEN